MSGIRDEVSHSGDASGGSTSAWINTRANWPAIPAASRRINQPVTTKYLHYAKKHGAEIAVVNPYRELSLAQTGLVRTYAIVLASGIAVLAVVFLSVR